MPDTRTAVGFVPAPDGWTLHFPDPDGGPETVETIGGWTVYSNGDATPSVAYQRDGGGWIHDANEGNCYVVPPPDQLKEARERCSEILAYVQADQSDPNLYRMVQELLFTIDGTGDSK
jgi:hypothetical protein